MRLHRITLAVAALGALSACASNRNNDFLCPPQTGGGTSCVTLAQADAQVRTGVTPVTASSSGGAARASTGGRAAVTPAGAPRSAIPGLGARSDAAQFRQPEVVGTLWVAPHLDQAGLLHSEQSVMFVVVPARWGAQ